MLSGWLIYFLVGKLLIFLWAEFPLPNVLEKNKIISKLHVCDLCSGVWLYSVLSLFMRMDMLSILGFGYIPVISEVVTGCITSFLVHIFFIGLKEKFFPVIHVE